jgi:Oxidoreductase family, C-terminal alpha/beta domain
MEGRSAACAFYGEHGTLIVDRGGWKVYGQKDAPTADASNLLETHGRNFLDCLKTRKTPAADVQTAATSSALCHLGNIAHRVGHEVAFDAETGRFADDATANTMLKRDVRPEWSLS